MNLYTLKQIDNWNYELLEYLPGKKETPIRREVFAGNDIPATETRFRAEAACLKCELAGISVTKEFLKTDPAQNVPPTPQPPSWYGQTGTAGTDSTSQRSSGFYGDSGPYQ